VDTGSSGQPGQPSAVAQVDAAAIAPERLGTDIRNSAVLPELRDYMNKHGLPGTRARAEKGDATAQYMLGLAYSFGLRVKPGMALPEDWEVAADWLQKALLGGEIRAANSLGYIYWQGKIGPPNPKEAARIWTAAAERNVARAIGNLATLYRDGTAGVPKDVAKAVELFERAGAAKTGSLTSISVGSIAIATTRTIMIRKRRSPISSSPMH
jgi:TPR repeat protein